MRLARLLPALAATLMSVTTLAQEPPAPQATRSEATLFYPVTVARAEARGYDGTAIWRMIDLGPVRALEAVLSFPGADGDVIVLIEENPHADLPDDILLHAWPQWPATADGPAVAWAYFVGVEMSGEAQVGIIGTARSDWTTGLMASAAARNHERLRAASVLIVNLGLPDGNAFIGLGLGADQQALLAGMIPAEGPIFPLPGPAEPRVLVVEVPGGTGGVLWDTPHDEHGVTVRGRVFLPERGIGFNLGFALTEDGLVATVDGGAAALGDLAFLSVRTQAGDIALPAGVSVAGGDGTRSLTFTGEAGEAALGILRTPGGALALHFTDAAGEEMEVVVALPQTWNPFAYLAPPP